MPSPGVAEILSEYFVGLASDCDDPEPAVLDLAMANLRDAMMLPFVMFTDADGNYLSGSHGAVHPDTLRETLLTLTS